MCDGGEIMAVRGWWRQNYGWLWMVVGGWGKIMAGRVWSWMVSRFSNARDLFILMDSIITNTHSRRKTSSTFFDNDKYCLPDQGNDCHHTNKCTKT